MTIIFKGVVNLNVQDFVLSHILSLPLQRVRLAKSAFLSCQNMAGCSVSAWMMERMNHATSSQGKHCTLAALTTKHADVCTLSVLHS